jgi:acylphosphatase
MTDWIRKHMRVVGRVQGVGFRYFTKRLADRLGIVGYVRNMSNGDVEMDVAGSILDMQTFQSLMQKGPTGSRVQELMEQTLPLQNLSDSFDIRYF